MPASTSASQSHNAQVAVNPRVGTPGATRSAPYQLQQYMDSPRRNDPYFAGYGGHGDVVGRLADLDAVLSSLQKGGNTASL